MFINTYNLLGIIIINYLRHTSIRTPHMANLYIITLFIYKNTFLKQLKQWNKELHYMTINPDIMICDKMQK